MSVVLVEERGPWRLQDVSGKRNWSAERSAMQQKKCPECQKTIALGFNIGQLTPKQDMDGNIQFWKGRCFCGTELVVFND